MRWERNRLAIAAVVVLGMFAPACGSSSSSSSAVAGSTSTSSSASDSSSGAGPADVSGASTFDLQADNFFFSPAELDGKAGQTLKLTVKNVGSSTHTFTIDSENVDVTIEPGQEQQVTVTFPQSGSVEFYCKFHVSSGMKGTLTVA
jgi:plastocyanin